MTVIHDLKRLAIALGKGSDANPSQLLYGSALKIEDLDVTMKCVTYSWKVGSQCSVHGRHTVIVAERDRARTGTWYRVRFDDGGTQWVYWKRIGLWLHSWKEPV